MSPITALLLGALGGALLVAAAVSIGRRRRRAAVRRASARGYRGEREAVGLLEAAGYRIVEHQPTATYEYWIDDDAQTAEMCPDFLASRDGALFVVEVKTGRGRRPTHRGPRRQLLEYATYFEVDGALLVDADEGQVFAVDFPSARRASSGLGRLASATAGAVVGAVLVWILHCAH